MDQWVAARQIVQTSVASTSVGAVRARVPTKDREAYGRLMGANTFFWKVRSLSPLRSRTSGRLFVAVMWSKPDEKICLAKNARIMPCEMTIKKPNNCSQAFLERAHLPEHSAQGLQLARRSQFSALQLVSA